MAHAGGFDGRRRRRVHFGRIQRHDDSVKKKDLVQSALLFQTERNEIIDNLEIQLNKLLCHLIIH